METDHVMDCFRNQPRRGDDHEFQEEKKEDDDASTLLSLPSSPEKQEIASCPICFDEEEAATSFVSAPCGHAFCEPCLKSYLMQEDLHDYTLVSSGSTATASTLKTHCLGLCPLCRASMSWFELQRRVLGGRSSTARHSTPLCENQTSWRTSPLAGGLYAMTKRVSNGLFEQDSGKDLLWSREMCSVEFPASEDDGVPMIDISEFLDFPKQLALEQAHFDEPSRTFFGRHVATSPCKYTKIDGTRVKLPPDMPDTNWLALFTLSHDYRFFTRGMIYCWPPPLSPMKLSKDEYTKLYPLDGTWEVRPGQDTRGDGRSTRLPVVRGLYSLPDGTQDTVLTPQYRLTKHRLDSILAIDYNGNAQHAYWDWIRHPLGPATGSVLCFDDWPRPTGGCSRRKVFSSIWIRKSRTEQPKHNSDSPRLFYQIPEVGPSGTNTHVFRRFVKHSQSAAGNPSSEPKYILYRGLLEMTSIPTFNSKSVLGNTYVFGSHFKVGCSSYHFASHNGRPQVYVSFENPDYFFWMPAVEAGSVLPSRASFRNIRFPDQHTFQGQVLFQKEYGVTLGGIFVKWDVVLKFDTSFMCVVAGHCRFVRADSSFQTLLYSNERMACVNAGLFRYFQEQARPSKAEEEQLSWFAAHQRSHVLRQQYSSVLVPRLVREGASHRVMQSIDSLFAAASQPNTSDSDPVDYNLV